MCEVRVVPREGKNGIRLFVSRDAQVAYKILRSGVKISVRGTSTTTNNSKVRYNARRKQRYLKFAHALGPITGNEKPLIGMESTPQRVHRLSDQRSDGIADAMNTANPCDARMSNSAASSIGQKPL